MKRQRPTFRAPTTQAQRDYTDPGETATRHCTVCRRPFTGHTRRLVCRACVRAATGVSPIGDIVTTRNTQQWRDAIRRSAQNDQSTETR